RGCDSSPLYTPWLPRARHFILFGAVGAGRGEGPVVGCDKHVIRAGKRQHRKSQAGNAFGDRHKTVLIRIWQRTEEHRINYGEDGGVESDTKGQSRYNGGRKYWRFPQCAIRKS